MSDPTAALGASADRELVDQALARFADRARRDVPGPVGEAIAYALAGGGKRLRALLVLAAYRAAGGTGAPHALAATVEVVHAYSLVHDDLPCMDDDDVRRGRPTVHRAHGVAVATAAGVAMVPLAVRCAWDEALALRMTTDAAARVVRELMAASGAGGMVGGQLLDLDGEGRPLALPELERIHRGKTGALIAAAVRLGGLAAGASDEALGALERYGWDVGLAFQIADDVLDVTATSDQLGKTAGKDLAVGKSTYPALLGIEGARARARQLVDDGCGALAAQRLLTPPLERLARFSIDRAS